VKWEDFRFAGFTRYRCPPISFSVLEIADLLVSGFLNKIDWQLSADRLLDRSFEA
jgi:hypothetical protein